MFHLVRSGQTLYTIARSYGVQLDDIVTANEIANPNRIDRGDLLFIPGARKVLDEELPSNIFMADAWATSEDKPI